jgi:hypothetical protein
MAKLLHASYSGYFPGCLKKVSQFARSPDPSPMALKDAMEFYWRVSHWNVKIIPNLRPAYTFSGLAIKHKKVSGQSVAITDETDLVCTESANLLGLANVGNLEGYYINLNMGRVGGISNGYFGEYSDDPITSFTPNVYGELGWFYTFGSVYGSLTKGPLLNTPIGTLIIFFESGEYVSTLYGDPIFVGDWTMNAELTPASYRTFEEG